MKTRIQQERDLMEFEDIFRCHYGAYRQRMIAAAA